MHKDGIPMERHDDTRSLADAVRELARLDRTHLVFGAQSHGYQAKRVAAEEIADFESWCGCPLPPDYRQFISSVGTGVGPYYGLYSFAEIRREYEEIYDSYLEEDGTGPSARASDPFELESICGSPRRLRGKPPHRLKNLAIDCPSTAGGFIPICSRGCEFVTLMVTSGACAGMVFDTDNGGHIGSHWFPAKRPPGILRPWSALPDLHGPTFSEWISGWLEQCFLDLKEQPE